eukprot:TRINITY_DN24084_c0_g1_i1.p1 TRINITY_DN24084_c0_g1~~TRINITY_DN24084_c0_g1_i1.p1  ORF type:complete len:1006 (+),score=215.61 TRINITY_DN24084_c0_g1_i1:162-3179(+)
MVVGLTFLLSLGGAVLARSLGAFSTLNGLFGSAVAVTGDAHQAQVAQDIFRADLRIELSQLVREDMRDIHALQVETVSTQVTMGSIVLGVCFAVLIEGYQDAAVAPWILEMWAMLTSWAMLLTFTSLLLSLHFQTSIKNAVREQLLLKHRIDTPNDVRIAALGGYSLAEQVARLHNRVVSTIVSFASGRESGSDGAGAGKEQTEGQQDEMSEGLEVRLELIRAELCTLVEHQVPAAVPLNMGCILCRRGGRLVMVNKNVQAWYDDMTHALKGNRIVDCPNYLLGATLIRQQWCINFAEASHSRRWLEFEVFGEATIYVAGRPHHGGLSSPTAQDQAGEHAIVGTVSGMGASPRTPKSVWGGASVASVGTIGSTKSDAEEKGGVQSVVKALELEKLCKDWRKDEMPKVMEGGHESCRGFRKVDGYSIFVDSHSVHLPLYRLPLKQPEDYDWPVRVAIEWGFNCDVEALTVIVREGCIVGSEEEFAKQAFLQEIDALRPHLSFAGLSIRCATTCLVIGTLLMHLARVLIRRPIPESLAEVAACAVATVLALAGIWFPFGTPHRGVHFGSEGNAPLPERRLGSESMRPKTSGRSVDSTPAGLPRGVSGLTSVSKMSRMTRWWAAQAAGNSLSMRRRRRVWRHFTICFGCFALLFIASVLWCLIDAVIDDEAVPQPLGPEGLWQPWPAVWPPLLRPAHMSYDISRDELWVSSDRFLTALSMPQEMRDGSLLHRFLPASAQQQLRLPSGPDRGLCFLGRSLALLDAGGQLNIADFAAQATDSSAATLRGALLSVASEPPTASPHSGLVWNLRPPGSRDVAAIACAPEARFWGAGTAVLREASAGSALAQDSAPEVEVSGVLALARRSAALGGGIGATVELLSASGRVNESHANDGRLSELLEIHVPALTPQVSALHVCAVGACADKQAWLWAADLSGNLVAIGLDDGEQVLVETAAEAKSKLAITALAGNATHLLVARHREREVETAPYEALLEAGRKAALERAEALNEL